MLNWYTMLLIFSNLDARYNALANKSVSKCNFGLGQSNQGQSHFEDSHGQSILVFNGYQPLKLHPNSSSYSPWQPNFASQIHSMAVSGVCPMDPMLSDKLHRFWRSPGPRVSAPAQTSCGATIAENCSAESWARWRHWVPDQGEVSKFSPSWHLEGKNKSCFPVTQNKTNGRKAKSFQMRASS